MPWSDLRVVLVATQLARAQRLADQAGARPLRHALGSAAMTAVVWSPLGIPDQAVMRTIKVLVIACPNALGPAIPLVDSIATERAAPRPHARQEITMIMGDAAGVADAVAGALGIDRVYAGVRPDDRAGKIAGLRDQGRRVAMVG